MQRVPASWVYRAVLRDARSLPSTDAELLLLERGDVARAPKRSPCATS